jgi:hypothetical protein
MFDSIVFKPAENQLVYHYCSGDTFNAICSNRPIRLSDIFTMNDPLEMHWGYSIWEKVATDVFNIVGKDFLDKVDAIIGLAGLHAILLSSSFSLSGRIPNQWEEYGDKGKGYCLGFDASNLLELPVQPLKIIYNEDDQKKAIKDTVMEIFEMSKHPDYESDGAFLEDVGILAFSLASFKQSSYNKEDEVRLIHAIDIEKTGERLKLVDNGGKSFKGQELKFLMKGNMPVTYLDYDFTIGDSQNPVKEVILGHDNNVLPTGIMLYLETNKIPNARIMKVKI